MLKDLVPLNQAGRLFPRPPHRATLLRWALKGVGNPRIRLQTWKIGSCRYTSELAVSTFIAGLSGEPAAAAAVNETTRPELQRANHLLDAEGFGHR